MHCDAVNAEGGICHCTTVQQGRCLHKPLAFGGVWQGSRIGDFAAPFWEENLFEAPENTLRERI